jgi:adenine/guanine phosphoribosyltransferase-like PRPP-binding protein
MTVKELIKKLEKVKDKDLEVIVQGTDPTDYIYYNDVEYTGTNKVYLHEDDTKKTKVFVIDGGMF